MRDIKVTVSKHSADVEVEYLIKMLSELFLYKKMAVAPTTTNKN